MERQPRDANKHTAPAVRTADTSMMARIYFTEFLFNTIL